MSDANPAPVYFRNPDEFRLWLIENHLTQPELVVGFYKVETGKPTMTWSESVDEAICFGWIDGIRKKVDEESYSIRFTPRNPKSNWSAINIKKVENMSRLGKMFPAGLEVFEKRTEDRSAVYSYENQPEKLPEEMVKIFSENAEAWAFFNKQSPSYQKLTYFWILSAKQEKTQLSRLEKLIAASAAGKKVV